MQDLCGKSDELHPRRAQGSWLWPACGLKVNPLPCRDVSLLALMLVGAAVFSTSTAAQIIEDEQAAFRAAVDAVAGSVVRIQIVGGLEQIEQTAVASGPSTGLIVDPEGYVVSSAYGFAARPTSIVVTLSDGTRAAAELLATDHSRKFVLLKINLQRQLPAAQVAPLDGVQVGQWAIAVGRALALDPPTRSVGIVSALRRMHGRALQTDAKVSPVNYGGPLIDLQGRVLGLLVPMSPDGESELAGAQWYDSGIGFAAPLVDVLARLEKMKRGEDQHRGLLGITLPQGPPYQTPPKVAAVRQGSPAAAAGLDVEDTIVAVDGREVATVTELRYQLMPRYAGDQVRVSIRRGEERFDKDITLVDQLPAHVAAFVGLLPLRALPVPDQSDEDEAEDAESSPSGVRVRYVYPDGPADASDIRAGDLILQIGDRPIRGISDVRRAIWPQVSGNKVKLSWEREGERLSAEVVTTDLPTDIPADLPPGFEANLPAYEGEPAEVGEVEIKLPEFPNTCTGFVPPTYRPDLPYGLLVWLPAAQEQPKQVVQELSGISRQQDLMVAVAQASGPRWLPTDTEYVVRLVAHLRETYSIDPSRVVIGGSRDGGTMAYRSALAARRLIRGVAVVQAPLPRTADPLTADPVQPLAVYSALQAEARAAARIRQGLDALKAQGVPVTTVELEDAQGLSADQRHQLGRWVDSLDRF